MAEQSEQKDKGQETTGERHQGPPSCHAEQLFTGVPSVQGTQEPHGLFKE